MLRILSIVFWGLVVTACASTGPSYEKANSERGYGYHESQLADNRYRVTFTARSNNDDAARDYALLRAAELTLQKGYDWFEVADRDTTVSERESAPSHVGVSQQTMTTCGLVSCSTTTRPVGAAHVHTDTGGPDKVKATVEFVMGKGKLPDGARFYQARAVADTIRAQRLN